MKKIAVGLFGIHYCKYFKHWMGWVHNIDYRHTFENNKNKIYNFYDVDYYSSTYYSNITENLLKNFDFKSIRLKEISNVKEDDISINYAKRNKIFKETIQLILQSENYYDYVILTRFDCEFLQSVDKLNIIDKKINFLCKSKCGLETELCDDNFYVIPYPLLNYFYKTISNIDEKIWSHNYNKYFNNNIINYMIDGEYYSHEIKFYQLNRIEIL